MLAVEIYKIAVVSEAPVFQSLLFTLRFHKMSEVSITVI